MGICLPPNALRVAATGIDPPGSTSSDQPRASQGGHSCGDQCRAQAPQEFGSTGVESDELADALEAVVDGVLMNVQSAGGRSPVQNRCGYVRAEDGK